MNAPRPQLAAELEAAWTEKSNRAADVVLEHERTGWALLGSFVAEARRAAAWAAYWSKQVKPS